MPARSTNHARLTNRWKKLPAGSRHVLTAVALFEDELSNSQLSQLAAQLTDVDPLVTGRWLRETDSGRWRLEPSAAAVRSLAPWSVRRAAHLALARLLERHPADGARAATHYESAGRTDEAGRAWLNAARHHCRHHRHRVAAECFAQAIQLLPGDIPESDLVAAVRDFGTCATLQGDTATALPLIQQWREQPVWQPYALFQAEAARIHAILLERSTRHLEGARLHSAAAHWFRQAGQLVEAATELIAAAVTLTNCRHPALAHEAASAALADADASGVPALRARARALFGVSLVRTGRPEEGEKQLEASLEIALRAKLPAEAANTYRLLGTVPEQDSRYGDEQNAFDRALSYCRRHGVDEVASLCVGCYTYSLFRTGPWRRALALAKRIHRDRKEHELSRGIAAGVLGLVHAYRGELQPARRLLAKALEAARRCGHAGLELLSWRGIALSGEFADEAEAAVAYRSLLEFWRGLDDRHDATSALTAAVQFFARHGRPREAAEFATAVQQMAAMNPNPELTGAAALAAAELKLAEGDASAAVTLCRQALHDYGERGLIIEGLCARFTLGRALAAAGETTEAARVLRETRAHSSRLGCRPYAARAADALNQLKSPADRSGNPRDTLSPRQRDVAGQLVAGKTNKEIAAALGLSVRTVDMHVAHLLARLDCRTRAEAAARFARAAGS